MGSTVAIGQREDNSSPWDIKWKILLLHKNIVVAVYDGSISAFRGDITSTSMMRKVNLHRRLKQTNTLAYMGCNPET